MDIRIHPLAGQEAATPCTGAGSSLALLSDRRWRPTPADLLRDFPTNPLAGDRVNPYEFDRQTYTALSLLGLLDAIEAGLRAQRQYAEVQAQADALLRARPESERLLLAHKWASERGYPSFVRDMIWRGIKRDFPQIAKDAAIDTGAFIVIQWIPVIDVLYDAYIAAKGAYHAIDAAWLLASAERAAASATSIVGLQRASARLTLAEHTEALKLVVGALEAFGGWSAMRGAMKRTGGALADEAGAEAGKSGQRAVKSAASGAERVAAGTAREVALPGERHVLTIVEQLGRVFVRMCSPTCGELVIKLRRLLVYLNKAGSDTFAQDPVARLLEKAMKLDARLAKLTQKEADEQLASLAKSVEELGGKHTDIAKALPEIESITAGEPTLYPNLEPRRLGQELAKASQLGVQPMRAGGAGFDGLVNQGTIKFVITEDGELLVMSKHVTGVELAHTVLSRGRPVLAAGEADISSAGEAARIGVEIKMHSGHFKPDILTESLARDVFKKIGVVFP